VEKLSLSYHATVLFYNRVDEKLNRDTALVYLDGAREALQSARYNLRWRYYGVAVNRAYYAFFYAARRFLLTMDITRSKHAGVLAAFREYLSGPAIFRQRTVRLTAKPLSHAMSPTMRCWARRLQIRRAPSCETPSNLSNAVQSIGRKGVSVK